MVTVIELKKYALEHGLFIQPRKDILEHCNKVNKNGHCPCALWRKSCPCEYVEEDLKNMGNSCKCTFFVNESYLIKFNYSIEEAKKHTELTPEEEE